MDTSQVKIPYLLRKHLKKSPLLRNQAFVNGQWVSAASGSEFQVCDPATGDLISTCPEFNRDDAAKAIEAAAVAQETFRLSDSRARAKMLSEWSRLMRANIEALAMLLTWENGKTLSEARGEINYAAAFFDWFAGEAIRCYGDFIQPANPRYRSVVIRQPVGVCGLITPWNFPAAMITRKVGPAIAAGCTVVVKAPAETPLTALALAHLSIEAGVPAGVYNVATALKNTVEIGQVLTGSPLVHKISFTGSTRVGSLLMSQSASTLKKVSLELGGLAPFIVFDDADIDSAVEGAIASKFRGSGQTCVCANLFLIHRNIYDSFAAKFVAKVKGFRLGPGLASGTTHGPLIHEAAVAKVADQVQDALAKGGEVAIGGQPAASLGACFFEPTVILNASGNMKLSSEETFGPVAGLIPFETEAEAIKIANRADVGLAAYFFSKDIKRCWRVAEKLEVGMVGVNTGLVSDLSTPFGGVKQSGFGREGSKYGLDEYTTLKTITFAIEG
ncbi:succinate-semialdehyde dehydrogenase-like protein [Xylaria arbuscula]|nr:succinate-semialdehyde dehydrogenase-like protein [Xylaria arbuscula]